MKKIYGLIVDCVFAVTSVFILFSCQKNQTDEYVYLRLDQASYMFKSTDADTCNVQIECNSEWSISTMPDWITVADQGEDYVCFIAEPNVSKEIRMGNVDFVSEGETSSLSVSQMFSGFNGRFYDLTQFAAPAMSRNGRYVGGMVGTRLTDGSTEYVFKMYDTKTGSVTEWEPTTEYNGVRYISNDGKVIVLYENFSAAHALFVDGNQVDVRLPEGYFNYRVTSVSDDYSIWVGYCQNLQTKKYHPLKWINGEPELLDMPESNLWGQKVSNNGTMVRGCSADGSVLYGTEWDTRGLVYWKDVEMNFIGGDPEFNILGYDNPNNPEELTSYTGIVADASSTRMSSNGRYISAAWYGFDEGYFPIMLDLETGNSEIVKSVGDGGGSVVDNNGNFFGGVPYRGNLSGYRFAFGEDPVPVTEWLDQTYGLKFVEGYMVAGISDDGKVLLGARAQVTVVGVQYSFWCVATDVFEE